MTKVVTRGAGRGAHAAWRELLVAVVLGLSAASAPASAADTPASTFESLRLALVLRDADAALRFADAEALEYYSAMLDLARRGREPQRTKAGRILRFEERALISALQNFGPPPVLQAKNARAAAKTALADPRYALDGAERVSMVDLRVQAREASASLAYRGQRTPFSIRFVRKKQGWRVTRVHLHPGFVALLEAMGVPPELDAATLERARLLWGAIAGRSDQSRLPAGRAMNPRREVLQ